MAPASPYFLTFLTSFSHVSHPFAHRWWTELRRLQQQVKLYTNQLRGHENWLERRRKQEAADLLAANALVVPSQKAATNQQDINAIYLGNNLWEDNPLDANTLQVVKDIADKCPLEGGFAVYEARSIYRRFDASANWDMEKECSELEFRSENAKQPKNNDLAFHIMPNPANETLLIIPNLELNQQAGFNLFSSTGKIVAQRDITAGYSPISVDTRDLPAGIYFYQIHVQGNTVQNGKFLIAH